MAIGQFFPLLTLLLAIGVSREESVGVSREVELRVSRVDSQDPSYLVLVPSVIRQGRLYDVSVQTFNARGSVTVKAEILNKNNGTMVSNEKTVINKSQFTVSLDVPVKDLEFRHLVRVTGSGGVDFINETFVNVNRKTLIILIQTDKAIYKPGQLVQFRCMAVYSDLKPYLDTFDIEISDGRGNKMAQWNKAKGDFGVFGDDFQLASAPPLGDWRIQVTTKTEETKTKSFTVQEFVLPKVEVKLELPPFFHKSRIPLVATISAKYTYGKPLSGTARVYLSTTSFRYSPKNWKQIIRTVDLVDGKKDLIYTKEDLEKLYVCTSTPKFCRDPIDQLVGSTFNITAVITDDITNDEHVVQKNIRMEFNLFRLLFLEISPKTFKDGLKWTGFIQLTLPDGSPPMQSDVKDKMLNVTYEFRGREEKEEGFEISFKRTILQRYSIPKGGIVTVEIDIPKGMSACDVTARFPTSKNNFVSAFRSMEKYVSRDDESLQISIPDLDEAVSAGDKITVVLESTVAIDHFYYQVISKGNIVMQNNQAAAGKNNQFMITFTTELAQETAPSARVVVWFMTEDNEIIVDSIEFNVKGAFANQVSLSFSEDEVKPADEVSLEVTTHKNSFVGMLAVDQSVLLLKGGNDITQDEVLNDLGRFNSGRSTSFSSFCFYCYFPRSLGGQDAKEVFENAGVQVMSDSYVHHIGFFDHGCYGPQRFFSGGFGREEDVAFEAAPGVGAPLPGPPGPPSQPGLVEPERVRDLFPETWIWTDDISGNDGKVTVKAKAPDTITSWVASAFSMSEDVGLGIAEETSKLVVFKAFFAQIDLPFSSIRKESLEVKVLVFNFLATKQKVTVTLERPPNDEFYAREKGEKKATEAKEVIQIVDINANDGVELSFWIKPVKLGQVPVEVKAQSTQAADALRRMLLVEPEGVPCVYTKTFFIGVDAFKPFSEDVEITFPSNVIEGSQQVLFSAFGDIMGSTMRNLDGLLRMPYGCGEQNMLTFAPNIFVLDYLKATNQLDKDIAKKAKKFMSRGYQNQLRFQRFDGSFSAFGNQDAAGSTWLTAFVVRSFERAKPYTAIEPQIIERGIWFILRQQKPDGKFTEPVNGKTIHTDMQGGASEGAPLTAYILITLIELRDSITNANLRTQVIQAIAKTENHLSEKLPRLKNKGDVYAMALITFAFTLNRHPKAEEAYTTFNSFATVNPIDGTKYWKREDEQIIITFFWRPPYRREPSNSIEMSGYGACISLMREDSKSAESIIKWLTSQRNSFGGYRSTQDTVVGIDALAKFASSLIPDGRQKVDVSVEGDDKKYKFDTITKGNFDVLQQREVSSTGPKMTIKAKGNGAALVQMSVFYHKKENRDKTGFILSVASHYLPNGQLRTRICFKYIVKRFASGMVVVEIDQLTGHLPITQFLLSQYRQIGLKRWEFLRGKKLVLYFDDVGETEICIEIFSFISLRVENLQHAAVVIFSYYKNEVADTKLYLPGVGDGIKLPKDCKKNLKKCDFVISSSGNGKSDFVKKGNIKLSLSKGEHDSNDFAVYSTPSILEYSGKICVEAFAKVSKTTNLLYSVENVSKQVRTTASSNFQSLGRVEMVTNGGGVSITLGGIPATLNEKVEVTFNRLRITKGSC